MLAMSNGVFGIAHNKDAEVVHNGKEFEKCTVANSSSRPYLGSSHERASNATEAASALSPR